MKKIWIMGFAVFLLSAGVMFSEQKVVEEIVARVNDDIITKSDYEKNRQELRQRLNQQYFGSELERQVALNDKNLLRELIDGLLLVQKAKEGGVNVETQLIKQLDEIREKNRLKTLDDLERMASQQGVNFEDFKNSMRNDLYTKAVMNQLVSRRVQITQEEVAKFYAEHKKELERPAEVRFREILISTEKKDDAQLKEAEKKAADIAARGRKGEDFAELAKKNSDGPTAKDGGEQDYIQRDQLLKEISDVAFSLKRNQVSDPIKTKFGFVIIKLEDVHEAGIPPLEKAGEAVNNALFMQKMPTELRAFLTECRQQSFVEVKAGYVDTGAAPPEAAKSEGKAK
jgi:peptidyl-prolyl cis-trans isomerase SurA